jgi:hypothetical protein
LSRPLPRIWVDADACPNAVREILFRAAHRDRATVILVANQSVRVPAARNVESVRVSQRFDAADQYIVDESEPGDAIITADVPLAVKAVRKGVYALSPRGELFTESNAGDRLATRDLMDELRSGGMMTAGPASFGPRERESFANQFDKLITKLRITQQPRGRSGPDSGSGRR